MGIILDSCVWIDLSSGKINPHTIIDLTGEMPIFTSVISLGELSFGVETCTNPAERATRAAFLRQVESRPTLEISKHTAASFGMLSASLKHLGRSPRRRINDLWIAAQAIEHGYSLLTLNSKDFSGFPGLRVITA